MKKVILCFTFLLVAGSLLPMFQAVSSEDSDESSDIVLPWGDGREERGSLPPMFLAVSSEDSGVSSDIVLPWADEVDEKDCQKDYVGCLQQESIGRGVCCAVTDWMGDRSCTWFKNICEADLHYCLYPIDEDESETGPNCYEGVQKTQCDVSTLFLLKKKLLRPGDTPRGASLLTRT